MPLVSNFDTLLWKSNQVTEPILKNGCVWNLRLVLSNSVTYKPKLLQKVATEFKKNII